MPKKRPRHNRVTKEKSYIFSRFFILSFLLIALGIFAIFDFAQQYYLDRSFDTSTGSLLVLGDTMLGRRVETYMNTEGLSYPFQRMYNTFARYDDILINFEAAIPQTHQPTPDLTFRFSVPNNFIKELQRAGISMTSLANNHTLDFGEDGYRNTKVSLREMGIVHGGHPQNVTAEDIMYVNISGFTVSIIPIHTTWHDAPPEQLSDVMQIASDNSEVQIVYVHWGSEYELKSNMKQKQFATYVIRRGADAVVGHHPHVVQEIEMIDNVPVFYSLGNFIFDQYWNTDVQTGLALGLRIEDNDLVYKLLPTTSVDKRSAPRLLTRREKQVFLNELAEKSDTSLAPMIVGGEVRVTLPSL